MKAYSIVEKRVIMLLVRDGYGESNYLPINAFDDIFYKENVEFAYKPKPQLIFYYPEVEEVTKDRVLGINDAICKMALCIKELADDRYITFLPNSSNSQLSGIKGFDSSGLKTVGMDLPQNIADIMFNCLNNSVIVSEKLKELAQELSIAIYIPTKEPNRALYFEKQTKQGDRSDMHNSVKMPQKLPGFVLCHNFDWDDNSYHNWYCLHFFDKDGKWSKIGELHLMHSDGESWNYLPDDFFALSDEFCSLGNNTDYYNGLRNVLGTSMAEDVLFALHDCAVNRDIYEKFHGKDQFRLSLYRDSFNAEKCLRLARFIINGRNMDDAFSFIYTYKPPYNEQSESDWSVILKPAAPSYERCIGVIGENGVGKTQLLRKFIQELISRNPDNFRSAFPIFSSIIAICSTPFDSFMRIEGGDFVMPFIKCSLEQSLSDSEIQIHDGIMAIQERGVLNGVKLIQDYVEILKRELPTEDIDKVLVYHDSGIGVLRHYELNDVELHQLVFKLSSGQLHTLMLLTKIYQHVYYDSLFVIDEPEVHLHPNAIMDFIDLLNEILDTFNSYAILTTHSPLVIREMLGKNVYVVNRMEDNQVYINHCDRQTFGEDISLLYKDTFDYTEENSCFRKKVKSVIGKNITYSEVIKELSIDDLSLNSRMAIRNLIEEHQRKKS